MSVGPARLAVQPRQAVVNVGAGLLAVVAADAEGLVDQQDVSTRKSATALYMSTTSPNLLFCSSM
jgi:hypothetical protein